MPAARRFLPLALAGVSAAGLLACGACGRSPSAPLRHVALRRTVTIEVRDSLGLPVPGAALWLTSQFDSAGLVTVLQGDTDDQGRLRRVLAEGGWIAWTGGGGGAAGGSFVVPGGSREPAETCSSGSSAGYRRARAASRCWRTARTTAAFSSAVWRRNPAP